MFNGDANPENLDNWIRQVEVYFHVQHIDEEEFKVQLVSLRLEGPALVWWERKIQDISKCDNILSSWLEFKSVIRKQFYPLGYLHKAMMEWKTLRKSKGQTVQSFTEEFRKKSLALNIPLDSYETLMKYIGALQSYICHTFLFFKPTSLIFNRGKHIQEDPTKKPSNLPHKTFKKFKMKEKNTTTMTREGGNPSCTHFNKIGHNEEHCWKLHPENKLRQFDGKGKTKIIAIVQQDLGSDSGDEGKIIAVGVQGKYSLHASSSSNNEYHVDERENNELFHIRVVSKHTKIDALFDSGSQVNLISETLVKKMGLEMKPHLKPYPLGWVCDKEKLKTKMGISNKVTHMLSRPPIVASIILKNTSSYVEQYAIDESFKKVYENLLSEGKTTLPSLKAMYS
jgi:hypothetical protein